MSRETHAELQIPANGAADVPYADHRAIARGLLGHVGEAFIGQVTGAGGAGGSVTGVPFEPAAILAMNEGGVAPATHVSIFSPTAAHGTIILATAANATPPTLTKVGDGDWTVDFPVGMLPDGEVMTCLIFGVRDTDGGL